MSERRRFPVRPVAIPINPAIQTPETQFAPLPHPVAPPEEPVVAPYEQPLEELIPPVTQPPKARRSLGSFAGNLLRAVRPRTSAAEEQRNIWGRMPRYFDQGDIQIHNGTVVFPNADADNPRDPRAGIYEQIQKLYDSLLPHQREGFEHFIRNKLPTAEERALPIGEAAPRAHKGTYRPAEPEELPKPELPQPEQPIVDVQPHTAEVAEPENNHQGHWTADGVYVLPGFASVVFQGGEDLSHEHTLER